MLSAEEKAILRRARGGGARTKNTSLRTLAQAHAMGTSIDDTPYPDDLSTEKLALLGTLDALLKAKPQPPRWALLRVLALLEEERALRLRDSESAGSVAAAPALSAYDAASMARRGSVGSSAISS